MSRTRTLLLCTAMPLLLGVGSVALAGPPLYAITQTDLVTIDIESNTITTVGPLDTSSLGALAMDSSGALFATRWYNSGFPPTFYRDLRSIDPNTGASTVIGDMPTDRYDGLAFQPGTGVLYSESCGAGELVTVDPASGAVTVVGPVNLDNFNWISGLAFDANGVLYGVNNIGNPFSGDKYRLVTFDLTTGAGTVIGTDLGIPGSNIGDIAFDTDTNILYASITQTGDIRMIDITTGLAGEVIYPAAAVNINGMVFGRNPKGDLNCDSFVNAFDIDPFVLAITDQITYHQLYPNCNIRNADCNGDGEVNAFDIDPFVALLVGL